MTRLRHTVHEVRDVHRHARPFRIRIGHDPRIIKIPAERIGYDDYDSYTGLVLRRIGDVGWKTVQSLFMAGRCAFVKVTGCAFAAGHGESDSTCVKSQERCLTVRDGDYM